MTDDTAATMQLSPDDTGVQLPLCLGGRFQLLERIGLGGMASIYRAFDQHFERYVAVKLMTPKLRADPEFDARFRREALIVSKLNDPHIVVVHDFGLDAEHGPYLVMELLEGESLRTRLNGHGPLSIPGVLQLGEQLMLALAHAHEHGVIHRDLKPDNVYLLAQSGVKLHVRILDFGIATMIRNPHHTDRPTETPRGTAVGTPRYMAPEQLAGKPASERSDLYSAAVVLYEALIGGIPEVMGPRLRKRRAETPDGLVRLIEQCLHSDPDERPVSAMEAYLHLHELNKSDGGKLLVSDQAVAQLTARFRDKAKPAQRSTRRAWFAAGAMGLALAALMIWYFTRNETTNSNDPPTGSESIAGIRIGDLRDDLVVKLGKPISGVAVPLAPLIEEQEISRVDDATKPEYLSWPDRDLHVALVGNEVRAVVARQSAATARNLRIGDDESVVRQLYSGMPTSVKLNRDESQPDNWSTIYRLVGNQITVEVKDGRITAIGLCAFESKK